MPQNSYSGIWPFLEIHTLKGCCSNMTKIYFQSPLFSQISLKTDKCNTNLKSIFVKQLFQTINVGEAGENTTTPTKLFGSTLNLTNLVQIRRASEHFTRNSPRILPRNRRISESATVKSYKTNNLIGPTLSKQENSKLQIPTIVVTENSK